MIDEIVFYQLDKLSEHLEVRIEDETVCINRKQNSNVPHEEPAGFLVVSKIATTAKIDKNSVSALHNAIMGIV